MGSAVPALTGSDAVHVWTLRLSELQARWPSPGDQLSHLELSRAARLRRPVDRARFLARRGLLRSILSGQLGCQPLEVPLAPTWSGRPRLEPGTRPDLRFSLSSSGDLVLVALASAREVGADIESEDPGRALPAVGMADLLLTPAEAARVRSEPDPRRRARCLLSCWTAREAVLKGLGMGLTRGLRGFDVDVRTGLVCPDRGWEAGPGARPWWVGRPAQLPGGISAVAVEGGPAEMLSFGASSVATLPR